MSFEVTFNIKFKANNEKVKHSFIVKFSNTDEYFKFIKKSNIKKYIESLYEVKDITNLYFSGTSDTIFVFCPAFSYSGGVCFSNLNNLNHYKKDYRFNGTLDEFLKEIKSTIELRGSADFSYIE
jgi:hypothetical protein